MIAIVSFECNACCAVDSFVWSMLHDSDAAISDTWIGLNDLLGRGDFRWSDQWPVVFTSWAFRQPDSTESKRCVLMNPTSGLFSTAACFEGRPSMCKITSGIASWAFQWSQWSGWMMRNWIAGEPPKPTPGIVGGCPENWYAFGSYCYLLNSRSRYRQWRDARKLCRQTKNTDLVSIEDKGVLVMRIRVSTGILWKSGARNFIEYISLLAFWILWLP